MVKNQKTGFKQTLIIKEVDIVEIKPMHNKLNLVTDDEYWIIFHSNSKEGNITVLEAM